MLHPDKVLVEAKKKEDENYKFRSFLKGHADEEELDEQFLRLHKELCNICAMHLHSTRLGDMILRGKSIYRATTNTF